jgi:hypothetical protein
VSACSVHSEGREKEKRPCVSIYVVNPVPAVDEPAAVVLVMDVPTLGVPVVTALAARGAVGAVVGAVVDRVAVSMAVGATVDVAAGADVGIGGRGVSVAVPAPPHAVSASVMMARKESSYRRDIPSPPAFFD